MSRISISPFEIKYLSLLFLPVIKWHRHETNYLAYFHERLENYRNQEAGYLALSLNSGKCLKSEIIIICVDIFGWIEWIYLHIKSSLWVGAPNLVNSYFMTSNLQSLTVQQTKSGSTRAGNDPRYLQFGGSISHLYPRNVHFCIFLHWKWVPEHFRSLQSWVIW